MITWNLLLLLLALLCFILAAFEVRTSRVNLFALGFVFWVLALMIVR